MRVWMCGDLHRHPVAPRCRMHCHYQQLTSMIKKQNVISLFVAFQLTFLITSFPHTPTRHPLDHIPKMASSEQDCMMQSTNQCFCLVPFVDRKSKPPACFVVYRLTSTHIPAKLIAPPAGRDALSVVMKHFPAERPTPSRPGPCVSSHFQQANSPWLSRDGPPPETKPPSFPSMSHRHIYSSDCSFPYVRI